jgi:hypothetical protein
LYHEPELYKKLQEIGFEKSESIKTEVVCDKLHNIFTKTIEARDK